MGLTWFCQYFQSEKVNFGSEKNSMQLYFSNNQTKNISDRIPDQDLTDNREIKPPGDDNYNKKLTFPKLAKNKNVFYK